MWPIAAKTEASNPGAPPRERGSKMKIMKAADAAASCPLSCVHANYAPRRNAFRIKQKDYLTLHYGLLPLPDGRECVSLISAADIEPASKNEKSVCTFNGIDNIIRSDFGDFKNGIWICYQLVVAYSVLIAGSCDSLCPCVMQH